MTNSPQRLEPTDAHLATRVHMMPKDTNVQGTVFGGVILSLIDQAGFYEARLHGLHRWVTVSMDAIEFHRPVWPGDVVSLYTKTSRLGRTSVSIAVSVFAERFDSGKTIKVTEAHLSMVSVDATGTPIPHSSPPSIETPSEPT
ncbi:MAG: acyl-CoA thioesterase [Planctomycetes bacterium]|nr:acyl-CoA thioesterase [Planctomycetota bacterium]MCP4838774.1 acyl-CoA thioesterase [Planctomycetota bacterium]